MATVLRMAQVVAEGEAHLPKDSLMSRLLQLQQLLSVLLVLLGLIQVVTGEREVIRLGPMGRIQ